MVYANGNRSYPNSRSLRALGGLVRALDILHPALASALVNRVFFMPFSKIPSAEARRALSKAERLSLPFLREQLAIYSWGKGPTVLLLHGWAANAGSMRHLIDPLVQAGFRAMALDAPAHGASPGRMTNLVEYGAAIQAAVEQYGPVRAIFAHSFGALAALLLLAEKPELAVEAVIVNNPPGEIRSLLELFAAELDLPAHLRRALSDHIETHYGKPVDYYSLQKHAGSLDLPGMLIVDPQDRLAKFESMQAFAAQWLGVRLVVKEGLGHQGALRDANVIQEAVSFIQALE